MKEGTVPVAEFYASLEHLAQTASIDLASYPKLAQYIRYVRQSADVSPTILADELDQFAQGLRSRLSTTPESRQLSAILETLALLDKMVTFDLSPEEHRQLSDVDVRRQWPAWESFLNEQWDRAGQPRESLDELKGIIEQLPAFQRFYKIAHERDEALVANAVKKLHETGEQLAVLITGGFHAPRITTMLKERGIATLVLIPKVSQATDDRLYRAVIKYKSGNGGSFEEVMALADQQVAP
jgi:hypothetical protein